MVIKSINPIVREYEIEFVFENEKADTSKEKLEYTVFLKNESSDWWYLSFYKNTKIPLNILVKIVYALFENEDFKINTIVLNDLAEIDDTIFIEKSSGNDISSYIDQLLQFFFVEYEPKS